MTATTPVFGSETWVRARISRGRRNALIGAGIGAVVGLALYLTLGADPRALISAVSVVLLGAVIGTLRDPVGAYATQVLLENPGPSTPKALRRIVLGDRSAPLDTDDQRVASRYAAVAQHWLPYTGRRQGLLLLAIGALSLSVALNSSNEDSIFSSVVSAASLILVVVTVSTMNQQGRNARHYLQNHPARSAEGPTSSPAPGSASNHNTRPSRPPGTA